MEINEIFYSIQGETKDVGRPTIFVRTQFCPLRCVWCDSVKTHEKGKGIQMTIEEVLKEIKKYPENAAICITGGEPLRQKHEVQVLLMEIAKFSKRRHVTVETDGQEDITAVNDMRWITDGSGESELNPSVDSVVMDWKVPSSGMHKTMREENLKKLRERDQIKFIVWHEDDLKEVERVCALVSCEILIGLVEGVQDKSVEPKNTLTKLQVIEWMKQYSTKFKNMRFQIQLHKLVGER